MAFDNSTDPTSRGRRFSSSPSSPTSSSPSSSSAPSGGTRFSGQRSRASHPSVTNSAYRSAHSASSREVQKTGVVVGGAALQNSDGSMAKQVQRRRGARILSMILFLIGAILIIAAVVMGVQKYMDDNKAIAEYEQYRTYITMEDSGVNKGIPRVDWDALHKVNPDIVAWISMPDSKINYPVLRGATNDTYLRTTPTGEHRIAGSIFLDSDGKYPVDPHNTMMYGHNMLNGEMFSEIEKMANQETFNSHPTLYYITPEKNYVLKPIFVYNCDGNDEQVRIFNFASNDDLYTYLTNRYQSATAWAPNVDLHQVSQVFQLVTCADSQGSRRNILVCVEDKTANELNDPQAKPVNNGAEAAPAEEEKPE